MRFRTVSTVVILGIVAAFTVAAPVSAHRGRSLSTSLTGVTEVPGPGDPDGSGTASLRIDHGFRGICFEIHVTGIALPASAAHIHQGTTGVAGPVVVTLAPPNVSGVASGCVSADRDLVKAIAKHPSDYYVNVHTTDYPNGALRGQLAKGAAHTDDSDSVLRARLSGASEVPGPGDPDGTGEAVIAVIPDQNEICFILVVGRISLPATAAHIHQGSASVAGPVVVTLVPPGGTGTSAACVGGLSHDLLTALLANPGAYYVNVHTADYPNGAVRGQLSADGNSSGHGCGDDDGDDDRSLSLTKHRDGGGGCGGDDDHGGDDHDHGEDD